MDEHNDPTKVEFEEEPGWKAVKYYNETKTPKIIEWVVNHSGGRIADHKQAARILFGFALVGIAISLFLFFGSRRQTASEIPTRVLDQMEIDAMRSNQIQL